GLLTLFEKVEVTPIQKEQALVILERLVPALERKYRRFVSWQALSSVIEYSDRYIESDPFPRKAIDLLDEALVYLSTSKEQVLLSKHVEKVVEERTQIPIGQMESQERTTLLNLESLIHERIINQEEAVNEVASALRRARSEVTSRKGPMGGFLFLGPTGVGKTETAKALAAIYFGSESRMIRLDMSEFQEIKDIARLLGSATQDGLLTTPVRENPFSLVLLDELEKAHPNILNLFLQVLDEGSVTDGLGRKVSFNNTIIIATSNAGYQIILRTIKEKKAMSEIKEELLDQLFAEGVFRPEFINRFDSVVIFQSLSQEHLLAIAGLMLKKLQRGLEEKGIRFVLTDELKAKMAELGYDPTFGARNMKRVIQDKVENALAEALLAETIKPGDTVSVNPETFLPEKI
ncbi:MAG: AAA family ATPase, partial [Candidatus Pacearchaeota archaeon]|nr:AAA family ATPase [Candidatus Pacearchaeota archaeon]